MSFLDGCLWLGRPRLHRYLRQYRRTQWLSPEELRELQTRRAREILEHAYGAFDFYRRKFDAAGVSPRDLRAPEDIAKFPLTEISELKEAVREGAFAGYREEPVEQISTTGSTGTPFVFPVNASALDERSACKLRTQEWYGLTIGAKNALLWRTSSHRRSLRELINSVVLRTLKLSVYDADAPSASVLDEPKLEDFCRQIQAYGPRVVDGYVSALTVLADFMERNRQRFETVRSVVSGAEYLSPYSRRLIERAFACRLYNRYGGSENSLIAHQCELAEDEELHVMSDKLLLEVLKGERPARPGELGEVVVTDFTTRAMPFIRCRLGDLAVPEDPRKRCRCGRSLPLLRKVEGRINDLFVLPDGGLVVSHVWHKLFREEVAIKEFQIVQRRRDRVTVSVVLEDPAADLGPLREKVADFLPGCEIEWREVETIPVGPGGKLRHSLSEVPEALNQIRDDFVPASEHVRRIQPYKLPADSSAYADREGSLKLDWNEGTAGPPRRVVDRTVEAIRRQNFLNWYPERGQRELRDAICRFTGASQQQVEIFNGSDGALSYLARTFVDRGEKVNVIGPTYDQFRVELEAMGGEVRYVLPEDPFAPKMTELTARIDPAAKLVYLVNPNNPTGVLFDRAEVEELLSHCPNSLVVVDEAYVEFCHEHSSVPLLDRYANLCILRTFSKAFCLAGLRIGYLLTHERYLETMRRIKNSKEVNAVAMVAATEALACWEQYRESVEKINAARRTTAEALANEGFVVRSGHGNFLLLQVDSPSRFLAHLESHGIYGRDRSGLPMLAGFVRLTIGHREEMARVVDVVREYKATAGKAAAVATET